MEMYPTFSAVSIGIAKLFILMAIGYSLYFVKFIEGEFIDKLSQLLVRVLFPCLIFSKIVQRFSYSEYADWWIFPLVAILFTLSGMLLGAGALLLGKKKAPNDREFLAAAGFQNSAYLPMNMLVFSFPPEVIDKYLIYVFLFTVGFDVLLWTIVPAFFSRNLRSSFSFRKLWTPPVIAIVVSLLWVLLLGKGSVPGILIDPVTRLGETSFPIAMFVLGAYLARHRAHDPRNKPVVALCILLKLVVFPLIILSLFPFIRIAEDQRFFFFLQAVMPTAISLVIIGAYTKADNEFLSSVVFYSHLISVISIPLWFQIFAFVSGI